MPAIFKYVLTLFLLIPVTIFAKGTVTVTSPDKKNQF
jgi:hypothetical protein